MKDFHQYLIGLLLALLTIPLVSCDDDDDDYTGVSMTDVAGEWYVETGDATNENRDRNTFVFDKDGTFIVRFGNATKEDGILETAEGTYSVNGKRIREQYTIYGQAASATMQLVSLNRYDMRLFYPDLQMEEVDHRIIDTWHMKVGETDEVLVNDPDFVALEYSSDDETVVTVTPTGTVEAVRQGTAYVLAVSDQGTAVIRVVVEHPKMVIDDFMDYFGENISVATQAYGDLYGDQLYGDGSGWVMRHYFLIDDKISEVGFSYNDKGVVEDIRLILRDQATQESVIVALNELYEFRSEYESTLFFRGMKNSRAVSVSVDRSIGFVQYQYVSSTDPYAAVDALITMTASEAAAALGHEITDEERAQGMFIEIVWSQVCRAVTVRFDPATDKITMLRIYFMENISYSEVDAWYAHNYIATGFDDGRPRYYREPSLWIYLEQEDGAGSVVATYMP